MRLAGSQGEFTLIVYGWINDKYRAAHIKQLWAGHYDKKVNGTE